MKPKWRWHWWLWFYNRYQDLVDFGWRRNWWDWEGRLIRCLECGCCCGRYFCTCHHLHGTKAQREAQAKALAEFIRDLPATKLPPRRSREEEEQG